MDLFTRLASFYDQIQDSVAVFDQEGNVTYCNDAFSVFTGYSIIRYQNRRVGLKTAFKLFNNQDFQMNQLLEMVEHGGVSIVPIETKAIMRGLAQLSVRRLEEISDFPESKDLFVLSLKDLTLEEELIHSFRLEIDNRNKKLQEMNQLIEILQKIRLLDDPFDTITEFISYLLNSNKVYLAASRIGENFSIMSNETDLAAVIGAKMTGANQNDEKTSILNYISQFLKNNKTTKYICMPADIKNSQGQPFYWSAVPFKIGHSEVFAIFVFETEAQKEAFSHQSAIILSEQLNLILNNLTLKELAITDGLTKLRNSLFFREKLDELCSKHQQGQLILFDVDFFKKVNDTYGHLGGDAVLITLGEKIPAVTRQFSPSSFSKTIIARVGGEEFAIFIPDKSEDFAMELAEKLRTEIEATEVQYNQITIKFTISMGIASWDLNKEGYSDKRVKALYKTADEALYQSKKTGRNRVSFHKAS